MRFPYLFIILILICFSFSKKTEAVETLFFETLYDIPVMSGLEELKEMGTNFDKAQGRIASAVALGQNIEKEAVLSFYSKALPELGWKSVNKSTFVREQEKLQISFEKKTDFSFVRFALEPIRR